MVKKKVLIISSFSHSLINFRLELLGALKQKNFEVVACAPDTNKKVIDTLNQLDIRFVKINLNNKSLNPIKDIVSFFSLFKCIKKENPDIVLSYTIKPVIYGSIAAKLAGVKRIASIITGLGYVFLNESFKGKTVRWLVRYLYRLALLANQVVFFQNPDDKNLFVQNHIVSKRKVCLVDGSGINLKKFTPKDFPSNKINFLLIARLLKDKGAYEYIAAAKCIMQKHSNVNFTLVGAVDANPSSVSQAELDQWKQEGIDCLGWLDDVRPAIEQCSVYVLPSYREGTPRSVLEAMAMGRPIITTDAPGCRETVVDGINGYLVPVKNVDRLVDAMEVFINNPELIAYMGRESRKIAEEKYDVHKINQVILDNLLSQEA